MVPGIARKLTFVLAIAGVAVAAAHAGAGSRPALWTVNGPVDALAVAGHTLFVGGSFSQIAPRTGPLLGLSASGGARSGRFPRVDGRAVYAVADDGRGGWFVGGGFDRIGGVACRNLAHVTAALAVDRRFCPRPNEPVLALTLDGSTLYAGGSFDRIGGVRRPNLAALDARSGQPTSWVPPALDDDVTGIAVRRGVLYLLGDFASVGGKGRFSLAAVDVRTRAVTGWDPRAPSFGGHGDTSTRAIAATANAIYVGGLFDRIGGKPRSGLAALDPVTGRATAFVPFGKPWIFALEVNRGRLYAAGSNRVGAGYLLAYDAATGKRIGWSPSVDPGGVSALAFGPSRVYAGGERLQAFDSQTGRRAAWRPPPPNQPVLALAGSGRTVVAGGSFTGAGGVRRDDLAAVDLRTGRPTRWSPAPDPQMAVTAIAISGPTVYIGGAFEIVGARLRSHVAALDGATGRLTSWAPRLTTDQVLALALDGSNVYIGGFGLATSYDRSGAIRWNSPPQSIVAAVNAFAVVGSSLYVGGDFDVIGGASRNGLAALDTRNGSATALDAKLEARDGVDPEVDALALSGSTLLVGGQFDSAGGAKRTSLAALDTASGKWTAWAPRLTDIEHVYALAVEPGAVYAGGTGGIRAFDPKTGRTLAWHPSVTISGDFPTAFVRAIAVVGSTVYVGDEAGLEAFPR